MQTHAVLQDLEVSRSFQTKNVNKPKNKTNPPSRLCAPKNEQRCQIIPKNRATLQANFSWKSKQQQWCLFLLCLVFFNDFQLITEVIWDLNQYIFN